jgi:hypothetical protein
MLGLAGCSLPPGIDGKLANNWSSLSAPAQQLPQVGACYVSTYNDMLDSPPVACTTQHAVEVAYVGTFTGATASRVTPPPAESVEMKSAYASCQKPVNSYLGGDWHRGLVTVDVTTPTDNGWTGGARWYRCDVSAVFDLDYLDSTDSSVSLKGVLTHSSAYNASCVRWTDHKSTDRIDNTKPTSCSSWFNGEYAGFYTAPNQAWPTTDKKRDAIAQAGCETVVGHYLGFSGNTFASNYVGWVHWGFDETRWNSGDRTIRCFTWNFNGNGRFTASVKGIRGNRPKG